MFHVDLPVVAAPLALVLLFGTIGVAATGTLFGAMTVRTRARDLVLATVLFPLLSPTLVSSVGATREIISAAAVNRAVEYSDVQDYVLLLVLFDFVAVVGGIALFGALVED
jgi:heme exporter protein B